MIRYQIACAALLGSFVAWPLLAQPGTNIDTGRLTTNNAGPSSSDARLPQVDGRAGTPGVSAPGQAPSAAIPSQAPSAASGQAGMAPVPGQQRQVQPGMPAAAAPGMQAGKPYTPMPWGSVAGQAPGMGAVASSQPGHQPGR